MSTTFSQEQTFRASRTDSEMLRQADIGVAKATLTGTTLQTAIDGAHRGYHGRVVAAARTATMSAEGDRAALVALNKKLPFENFSRTDTTTMTLVGGRYVVTVAGTFGLGGVITLVDANGDIFATFTEAGNATVDLKYGVYHFAIASVTDVAASVVTGTY